MGLRLQSAGTTTAWRPWGVGSRTKRRLVGVRSSAGVGLVAGGLALAPLITSVLALTAPAVHQELSSFDAGRQLTLLGMVGQFDGLDSATGVVALVVIVVAALVGQLIAAIAVLVTTRSRSAGPFPWLPVVLMVTGVAVALTTMLRGQPAAGGGPTPMALPVPDGPISCSPASSPPPAGP